MSTVYCIPFSAPPRLCGEALTVKIQFPAFGVESAHHFCRIRRSLRSAGILPAPENAAGTAALHKNPTARDVAMRFRKTLTFLIVATALPFAQPAGARQRNLAPASRSAFCSGGVPTAGRRSETAATVANASACAAILPALPAGVKQNSRPFIQDQVQAMVRDGFGDESGAKLVARMEGYAMMAPRWVHD